MRFLVLAIDFDGTIAMNDTLDPAIRAAFAVLRGRGIVIILVTGRIIDDLRRLCGDLHFVDAVVAENGAFIEFPASGYSTALAPPPSADLIAELRRLNIVHATGRTVIEAAAQDGARILEVLRRLELPLALTFNRSRVMVLPQATSKATGLQHALTILRLSAHNAFGIGDAENDHELLRLCEVGAAVEWGSEVLKRAADIVLPGSGPPAVAEYLLALLEKGYLPIPQKTRRKLMLGYTDSGEPLSLAVRGRNVLLAGEPKSGKSWVAGLLCEQLIMYGYSICVIDPEGDYLSLDALPGVTVMGGLSPLPRPIDLVRALRHADVSIVIDLSHTTHDRKLQYVNEVLPALGLLRRRTGLPHRIVLDEAHYFFQTPDSQHLLDPELNGYTLVTYRASALHEIVLKASQAILVTHESDPEEIVTLKDLCTCAARTDQEWTDMFRNLVIGEAAVLPVTEEAQGDIRRIHLARRLTPHVRHLAKYVDIPVSANRAFVFWDKGAPTGRTARTLHEFIAILDRRPESSFDGHLRRKDFSTWIIGVFGDHQLGEAVSANEDDYLKDHSTHAIEEIVRTIQSRYEFTLPGEVFAAVG